MSFDEIFDLTAGVYIYIYIYKGLRRRPGRPPVAAQDSKY